MKYVLCPPCGTVFEGKTEEDVIREAQSHAKELHGYTLPAEEVREAMSSTSPRQSDATA